MIRVEPYSLLKVFLKAGAVSYIFWIYVAYFWAFMTFYCNLVTMFL